jgi:hypothetical protein
MDNETLKLVEDCRDLLRDINSCISPKDSSKKLIEKQIHELNKLMDNELSEN